jgi:hypothetical protein
MSERPIGVTVLAVVAVLGAIVMALNALQYLGLIPHLLGGVSFFGLNPLAAGVFAIGAAIFAWLAHGLWRLQPAAWVYTVIHAIVMLVVALLAVIGASTLPAMLPTFIINAVILVYTFTPGVRRAFGGATA